MTLLILLLSASAGANPTHWTNLEAQDGELFSDESQSQTELDWTGEFLYAIENETLKLSLPLATLSCADTSEPRWRLVFSTQEPPELPEYAYEWTCEELSHGSVSSWTASLNQPQGLDHVTHLSQEGNHWVIELQLVTMPAQLLTTVSVSAISFDGNIPSDIFGASDDGLEASWSQSITLDTDQDGLSPSFELQIGTDPNDGDTDDDGLHDGLEYLFGTDPMACDSDGDGLMDATEVGIRTPHPNTDTDFNCFVMDVNPSTTTDPLNIDTDGGGRSDGSEDINLDGHVATWEGDPNDPNDDIDSDNDQILDVFELECSGSVSEDSDLDGVTDVIEGLTDNDSDGQPDFCDEDDDDDGILTSIEGVEDFDQDGLPNHLDTDSDNDGLFDSEEGLRDDDCDDKPDYLDSDLSDGPCSDNDGDGLTNDEEVDCGTNPDMPDSDLDGLLDIDECAGNDSLGPFDPNHPQDSDLRQSNEARFGCQTNATYQMTWTFMLLVLVTLRLRYSNRLNEKSELE